MTTWRTLKKQLQAALVEAFNEAQFEQMLAFACDKELSNLTADRIPFPDKVYRVIDVAERDGWLACLLKGAREAEDKDKQAALQEVTSNVLAFISLDKGGIHTSLPKPDVDVRIDNALPLLQIYPVENSTIHQPNMQFDLGAIWGLSRGKFIGILASESTQSIYESLANAEKKLFDAFEKSGKTRFLPTRWWLRVIESSGIPPTNLEDILKIVDSDQKLAGYLALHGIPDNVILGLIVQWKSTQDPRLFANWCQSLLTEALLEHPVSLVIHVASSSLNEAKLITQMLRSNLENSFSSVSKIELMYWKTLYQPPAKSAEVTNQDALDYYLSDVPIVGLEANDVNKTTGSVWLAWVNQALQVAKIRGETREQIFDRFIYVIECSSLLNRNGVRPAQQPGSASVMVQDLSQLLDDLDQTHELLTIQIHRNELHIQFLRLIESFLPEQLLPLLSAYAGSHRKEAQRSSLLFAAKYAQDDLLDAWVAGIEEHPLQLVEINLQADSQVGSLLDRIVIVLLRRFRDKDLGKLEEIFQILAFTEETQKVFKHYLHPTTDFWSRWSAREYLLAIEGGISLSIQPEWLISLSLEARERWWLLQSLPVSTNQLVAILSLSADKRAIFDMCTKAEMETLLKRGYVASVQGCRRNRPCHDYY